MKRLLAFLLASVMLLSLASCAGEGETTTAPDHTHDENGGGENEKLTAPDFTVYDSDGKEVSLSDMKGKPVVVNFWASWCGPCKAELPDFDEVAKGFDGKVVFMMVNLTDGVTETEGEAKAFVKSMGYDFPVYYDKDQDAAYTYGISAIPLTCFIDKDGYLVAAVNRMMDKTELERRIATIYIEESDK